jgi:hypothetical protein
MGCCVSEDEKKIETDELIVEVLWEVYFCNSIFF